MALRFPSLPSPRRHMSLGTPLRDEERALELSRIASACSTLNTTLIRGLRGGCSEGFRSVLELNI